jgi:nucleotide-binding universal stress UspA family protein
MSSTGQLPEPKLDAGRGGTEEAPAAERLDRLDADATKGLDVRVVGVAYDGSPESRQALRKARLLAEARQASLRIITAIPPLEIWISPHYPPEVILERRRAGCQRLLDQAAGSLSAGVRRETVLGDGHPADVIVREAHNGVDVLFMGSRTYGRWGGAPSDSTAIEVMRLAPCPVIVVGPGSGLSHVIHTAAARSSPVAHAPPTCR